jgi:lipoprotein NlpD
MKGCWAWIGKGGALALLLAWLAACHPLPQRYLIEIDPNVYIVQTGDTLESIAWRYQVGVNKLILWNNLKSGKLRPGQTILVRRPAGGVGPVAQTTPSQAAPKTQPAPQPSPVQVRRSDKAASVVGVRGRDVDCITCQAVQAAPEPRLAVPARNVRPAAQPAPVAAGDDSCSRCGASRVVGGVRWHWPADGRVIAGFGSVQGLEIAGEQGQSVRATASGRVVYSGPDMDDIGSLIIIEHSRNSNLLSTYSHIGRMLVSEGDQVRAGQRIAQMAREVDQQVRLHFEIRRAGEQVDPMRYLPER